MTLETVRASGLFLIADPHLADIPPGQRLDGYLDQIMTKLKACLDRARDMDMVPVLLGDLFHWPRDNSNKMLVDLIRLFGSRPDGPAIRALVGNHDKYQSRFTDDVSLAVLETAGVLLLMKESGPQFILDTGKERVLVCASPDGTPLPKKYDRKPDDPETVVWLTHHNIRFPEFIERAYSIKELHGIDWLINGHIHRPQPTITKGTDHLGQPRQRHPADLHPAVHGPRTGRRHLDARLRGPGKMGGPFPVFRQGLPGPGPAARGTGNRRGIQFYQGVGAARLAADPRGDRP